MCFLSGECVGSTWGCCQHWGCLCRQPQCTTWDTTFCANTCLTTQPLRVRVRGCLRLWPARHSRSSRHSGSLLTHSDTTRRGWALCPRCCATLFSAQRTGPCSTALLPTPCLQGAVSRGWWQPPSRTPSTRSRQHSRPLASPRSLRNRCTAHSLTWCPREATRPSTQDSSHGSSK